MTLARLALVAACLLALPASASAATRLAAPDGAPDGDCLSTACTLQRAVTAADDGDTISLESGTYDSGAVVQKPVFLEGDPDDRPVIGSSMLLWGATMRNVDVSSGGVSLQVGGTIENAKITSSSGNGLVIQEGGHARNVLVDSVDDGVFITGGGAVSLVGSTVRAGRALLTSTAGTSFTATVRNTILIGSTTDWWRGVDSSNATVSIDHSRFSTTSGPTPPGTQSDNISTMPDLDSAGHQNTGSVTIDAGTTEGYVPGSRDLDGEARVLGSTQDIGVDETSTGTHWVGSPYVIRNGSNRAILGLPVNAAVGSSNVLAGILVDGNDYENTFTAGPELFASLNLPVDPETEYSLGGYAEQDSTMLSAPTGGSFTSLALPDTVLDSVSPQGNGQFDFWFFSDPESADMTFHCTIPDVYDDECSSPWSPPPLPNGDYELTLSAVDWSGGSDPEPVVEAFTVEGSDVGTDDGDGEGNGNGTPDTGTQQPTTQPDTVTNAPPVQPVAPGAGGPAGFPSAVAPSMGIIRFSRRRIRVRIGNPNPFAATATVRLVRRGVTLARGSIELRANRGEVVVVRLTRAGRRSIRGGRRLRGKLTAAIAGATRSRDIAVVTRRRR